MTARPAPRAVRAADRAGDRHRRRAAGHRRVHPRPAASRPASSAPCSGCRAASIRRSSPTSWPRRSVPSGCSRADAVPDVLAGVARRRRGGRRRARLRHASSSTSRRWSTATSGPTTSRAAGRRPDAALRRGNFAARMRMAVLYDRSVTWGGLVVGTGNKTESLIGYTTLFGDNACAFNPIGDLYKSQVRQLAAAIGVPGRDRPQGAVGRPVARPDRRDRGRLQLPDARPAAVLADRQAALDRGDGRRSASTRRSSSGSTGWSPAPSSSARCRRSPSSGRGRPGVDYLYPRRRPGSARG